MMTLLIFAAGCGQKKIVKAAKPLLWPRPVLERVNCQAADRCEGEELRKYDSNFVRILNDNRMLRSHPAWRNPDLSPERHE